MDALPSVLGTTLNLLAQHGGAMLWRLLPFIVVFASLLVLESVALAKLDLWLPIDSMEVATRYSEMVASAFLWLRLCVIGGAVRLTLNTWRTEAAATVRLSFLVVWCAVAGVLVLTLLAVDLWRTGLRFSAAELPGELMRIYWLISLYVQIGVLYVAARIWFGASHVASGRTGGWHGAWSVTMTWQSLWLFVALLIVKLVVENVLVTVISYVPVVAPFWFVPNELSEFRYFVGQGTRIAAESLGVLFYSAFWLAVDREVGAK